MPLEAACVQIVDCSSTRRRASVDGAVQASLQAQAQVPGCTGPFSIIQFNA